MKTSKGRTRNGTLATLYSLSPNQGDGAITARGFGVWGQIL